MTYTNFLVITLPPVVIFFCLGLALGAWLQKTTELLQCPTCTCMCDENGAHLYIGDDDGETTGKNND